jgi:hypothetical protein
VSHGIHAEAVPPGEVARDFLALWSQWLCVHSSELRWTRPPANPAKRNGPKAEEAMRVLQVEIAFQQRSHRNCFMAGSPRAFVSSPPAASHRAQIRN